MFASLVLCWEPSLLRFCILNVHAHLQGILFAGMGGMVRTMPPPGWACHLNVPSYPSMVTVVWEVVTGAPRVRVLSSGQLRIIPYTLVPSELDVYLKVKHVALNVKLQQIPYQIISTWTYYWHEDAVIILNDKLKHSRKVFGMFTETSYQTPLVIVSFWWDHVLVLYIASPLTLSQSPTWRSLSSNTGTIRPSWVGPIFNSRLPPQLQNMCTLYFTGISFSQINYLYQHLLHTLKISHHTLTIAQFSDTFFLN